MFTVYKKSIEWGGKQLTLETGRMARQADGAVLATYGNTMVLATATFAKEPKAGIDFFPLTVNYQEKFYAGGRIPGGFRKREGQPGEREVLTSRLIDRPIRPLFAKGFKNETQVVTTVLQFDNENDADVVAMVAASAALTISGAPFLGPIGAARVGYIDGTLVLNPSVSERATSQLDLMVAGTTEGVLMVESEAHELPEDVMLEAVMFGHERFQKVIKAINELAEAAAKKPFAMPEAKDTAKLEKALEKDFGKAIVEAYKLQGKQDRVAALNAIRADAITAHAGPEGDSRDQEMATLVGKLIKGMEADVLRKDVLAKSVRIDGRKPTDIRPIVCEVDVLPRTHGSALFTRGETQVLGVLTLGTGSDEQLVDVMEGESKQQFLLHYNFPPFSVGETGRMGAPGRREIGHGKLAWRALNPVLPSHEEFPYTIRLVSEVLESNGSSSMGTVCSCSMAMMAAGVPLPRPVAGIAMGLVKEGKDYVVLSDIMGDEDHLGDMDFKVAGTAEGITALQMDIKITSITRDIMAQALEQAYEGRLHILGKMAKAITEARTEISDYAPAMESLQIHKDDIRVLIGKGGETIRGLCDRFQCTIDVDDTGKVTVAAVSRSNMRDCMEHIHNMFAKPDLGAMYEGEVLNTTDFGAFVSFMGGKEGLLHISEVVPVRLRHITDAVEPGDKLFVKVVDLDDRGKIRLSVKNIPQEGTVAERIAKIMESGGDGPVKRRDDADSEDDNRGNREGDDRPRRESRDRGGRDGGRGNRGGDRGRGPRRDRDGGGERRPRRFED
ncbi:MAG: polyribonucleotide nucleotidyltransferase [Pseudomonadaceae bacterium]|nr:polyribonucleotide nucleotidyltransferase [Pseudomonadaceae bacterium]